MTKKNMPLQATRDECEPILMGGPIDFTASKELMDGVREVRACWSDQEKRKRAEIGKLKQLELMIWCLPTSLPVVLCR